MTEALKNSNLEAQATSLLDQEKTLTGEVKAELAKDAGADLQKLEDLEKKIHELNGRIEKLIREIGKQAQFLPADLAAKRDALIASKENLINVTDDIEALQEKLKPVDTKALLAELMKNPNLDLAAKNLLEVVSSQDQKIAALTAQVETLQATVDKLGGQPAAAGPVSTAAPVAPAVSVTKGGPFARRAIEDPTAAEAFGVKAEKVPYKFGSMDWYRSRLRKKLSPEGQTKQEKKTQSVAINVLLKDLGLSGMSDEAEMIRMLTKLPFDAEIKKNEASMKALKALAFVTAKHLGGEVLPEYKIDDEAVITELTTKIDKIHKASGSVPLENYFKGNQVFQKLFLVPAAASTEPAAPAGAPEANKPGTTSDPNKKDSSTGDVDDDDDDIFS